ncbi:MAG: FAD-containing oxidoreductase [Candidatus Eisenbacteria bacterium]|nr:FAD-containing oxidoreductase [Candidatus Eisenbacteria bacterium]
METERFDAIVVGAGQGGVPLAQALAGAGRRTALIECAHVGGTCINYGCTPTKTMVASARVAHLARRAQAYGIDVAPPVVDLRRVRARKREIVESFRQGSEKRLAQTDGLELIRGTARFVGPKRIGVFTQHASCTPSTARPPAAAAPREERAPDRQLTAERIILDVGARPARPPIPNLEAARPLDSTSIMELAEPPAHLIVLGGGYVGLEFAQMFRRFGSRVTILQKRGRLLPREDADISDALAEILREEEIDILLEAEARAVTRAGDRVVVEAAVAGAARTIEGSELLLAAGRRSNADLLDLAATGLEADARGWIPVDEHLETGVPGIYAIGDVKGGPAFTHISYDDFRILCTRLLDGDAASTRGRAVPYVLYTDPELGRIGLTEAQARERFGSRAVRVAQMPAARIARSIESDETRGLLKVVVDREREEILGAAILAPRGGELMSLLQIAMQARLSVPALRDATLAHPTFAEALNTLFQSWED